MIFRKTISVFVILTFLLSNVAFAIPSKSSIELAKSNDVITTPDSVVVPRDFGLVKSKFNGNSGKLIIHIQDAHCNYEAQSNIAKILEGMIKNNGLGLVSVEGADGFIDTSWFKAFPDDEVRKEVADYFMKKGEITGPEFLSITTNLPFKLFGAETRSYYIQNLNAFTSSYPLKDETEKYFNSIKTVLNRLKGLIYSEELKSLDAKVQDYESKKLQFNDYIRFLQALAEHHKINLRSYENFFRLVSVLIYEKKIDFNVTDKERSNLIDELSKAIAKDQLQQLVAQSMSFKAGKISSAEYYAYLKHLAAANNIDLSKKYPNLYNYIIYNAVYSKIENEKLFQDLKQIEIAVKEKLFANDDQRTLEKLSRHIDILLGLINIKLMNGDFDYYQANKSQFESIYFEDFIKKKTIQYGLAYDLTPPSDAVSQSIPKLEDFYAIAIKRDKALVDNTLSAMKKEKKNLAVLVTGGFHSEGIAKLLEKQGVSYMVVCPTITKDVPSPYIQILTNQRTPLENILVGTAHAKEGMVAAPSVFEALQWSEKMLEGVSRDIGDVGEGNLKRRVEDNIDSLARQYATTVVSHLGGRLDEETGRKLAEQLSENLRKHKLPKWVKGRLVDAVNAEFRARAAELKEEFERQYREAAERKSPGENAVNSGIYGMAEFNDDEVQAMRAIQRQSFADGTYRFVTAQELGFTELGDFRFVVHNDLEARIERYNEEHGTNLPTDRIDAGTGGEEYGYGFRQAHISSYRFNALRSSEAGKKALEMIARHENGHIAIANRENSPAYSAKLANPSANEEDIVDSQSGANTREPLAELGGLTVRQLLAQIDRQRKADEALQALQSGDITIPILEAVVAVDETLPKGNEVVQRSFKLVAQARQGTPEGDYARDYLSHRAQLDAISEIRDIPTREGAGYGAYIFVSSSQKNAEYWQERFEKGRGTVLPKDAIILSVSEHTWKNPKGASNGFGTLNAWRQAEAKYNDSHNSTFRDAASKKFGKNVSLTDILQEKGILMMHMAGKATRMQTLAMNNKSAIMLPGRVRIGDKLEPLTVGESVSMNFGLNVRPGRLTLAWGDQNNIPSTDISSDDSHLVEIFGVAVPIDGNENFVTQKGLLVTRPGGAEAREILQREKLPLDQIIPNARIQDNRRVADMSLGFNSFRGELLEAMLEEFKPELDNEGEQGKGLLTMLNIDSECWGPFTSTKDEYMAFMQGKKSPEEAGAHWERVHRMFRNAAAKAGHDIITYPAASDVGVLQGISYGFMKETSEWWDWGMIKEYYENMRILIDPIKPGDYKKYWQRERLRRFLGLPLPEQWHSGSTLGSGATVENSIVLDSNIKKGRIKNSIVINSTADELNIEDAIVIGSTVYKLTCKGVNIVTDLVAKPGEAITLEPGEMLACHYAPDQELRMREVIAEFPQGKPMQWRDVGQDYARVVYGNSMSAEEASGLLNGYSAAERSAEKDKKISVIKERQERYDYLTAHARKAKMGTSGLRGNANVKDTANIVMTDQEVYINLRGQMRYMKSLGQIPNPNNDYVLNQIIKGAIPPGARFSVGGDRRESTARLCIAIGLAAIDEGLEFDFQGLTASPVIANWGMNREQPTPSAQVTASHNPPEQNGVKTDRWNGEILDPEVPIFAKVIAETREEEYSGKTWSEAYFDRTGILKPTSEITDDVRRANAQRVRENVLVNPNAPATLDNINLMRTVLVPMSGTMESDVYLSPADAFFLERYRQTFGEALKGKTVIVWGQSAVGRFLYPIIFQALGAEVIYKDSSDTFVSVDTEDLSADNRDRLRRYAREYSEETGEKPFAVVSFDGDSDRPVFCDENGEFLYGDKLGVLTNIFLGIEYTALPITANTKALDLMSDKYHIKVVSTRVGSPKVLEVALKREGVEVDEDQAVITALEEEEAREAQPGAKVTRKAGFECNGGYMLMSDIKMRGGRPVHPSDKTSQPGDKVLKALPTRDAFLPMLASMLLAVDRQAPVSELIESEFSGNYESYGFAGLVQNVPGGKQTPGCERYTADMGPAIIESFTPKSPAKQRITNIFFETGNVFYTIEGSEEAYEAQQSLRNEMISIVERLRSYLDMLPALQGVGINRINYLDGVRIYINNTAREIVHLRPSGNAAQFRMYAEAMTQARADEIIAAAKADNTGVLVRLIQDYASRQSQPVQQAAAPIAVRRSPGMYAASAGNTLIAQAEIDRIVALILENYVTGEEIVNAIFKDENEMAYLPALAAVSNELNKRYAAMSPEERETAWTGLERFYAAAAERALTVANIEIAKGLQIMVGNTIAIQNLIENGVEGAERIQITANPSEMLKSPDAERGLSYINIKESGIEPAKKEGALGIYWRGAEGISKLGPNVLNEMAYAENRDRLDRLVMYTMLHIDGKHTTVFLHDRLPGSIQHISTGKGHFQAKQIAEGKAVGILDIKRVARGEVLQFNDLYNYKGRVAETTVQKMRAGEWTRALPCSMDYMVPLTRIAVFNDVSIEVANPGLVRSLNPHMAEIMENGEAKESATLETTERTIALINHSVKTDKVVNQTVMNFNGKPAIVASNGALEVTQIGQYNDRYHLLTSGIFFKMNNMTAATDSLPDIKVFIEELTFGNNTQPKETLNTVRLGTANIAGYVKALEALYTNYIQPGKPFKVLPLLKVYPWGVGISQAHNYIMENLGMLGNLTGLNELIKGTGVQITETSNIGESWLGKGVIAVEIEVEGENGEMTIKEEYLPVEVLSLFGNEVYGPKNVEDHGAMSGITAKILQASTDLSWQIHFGFAEKVTALEETTVYVGLSNTMTKEDFIKAVKEGRTDIFNEKKLMPGETLMVPAKCPHAYKEKSVVVEFKDIDTDSPAETYSFYDRGRLNQVERAIISTVVRQANYDVEAAKLSVRSQYPDLYEKLFNETSPLIRPKKDGLTTSQETLEKIASDIENAGYLNATNPESLMLKEPILLTEKETKNEVRAEIIGMTEGSVGLQYNIKAGQPPLAADQFSLGSGQPVTVLKGEIKVKTEKGEENTLKSGDQMIIPHNAGKYTLEAQGETEAVAVTSYMPLKSETLVNMGFEAIRANLPAVRTQAVHLLTTSKAFRKGDVRDNEPGSFKYEREILDRVSNGKVKLFEVAGLDAGELKNALQGLMKGEEGVNYVVQLTQDEFNMIKDDVEMARLLKDTRLMVLPNVKLGETKGIPFIREIESAGVILGNTTEKDLSDKTAIAGWLKNIMTRLTGNKALDWETLVTLLKTPDPATFAERIANLLKNLAVKLEPYKADEGVRERRQLLWSV